MVVPDIVFRQGLLNEQQIKLIQGLKYMSSLESIGGIGIYLERQIGVS